MRLHRGFVTQAATDSEHACDPTYNLLTKFTHNFTISAGFEACSLVKMCTLISVLHLSRFGVR